MHRMAAQGLHKVVDSRGKTSYRFSPEVSADDNGGLLVTTRSLLGQGLIARSDVRAGDVLVLNSNHGEDGLSSGMWRTALPVGKNRNYICSLCHKISVKQKVLEGYECAVFCSDKCLRRVSTGYMHMCGELLSEVTRLTTNHSQHPSFSSGDSLQLLTRILYQNYCIWKVTQSISFELLQLLDLVTHDEIEHPDLKHVASIYVTQVRENCPLLLECFESHPFYRHEGKPWDSASLAERLLRVIRYNAQSIPYKAISEAYLLYLDPVLARINHSCAPNALIQVIENDPKKQSDPMANSAGSMASADLRICLLALTNISCGQEICISYLSDLLQPRDARRELLWESFHFECTCDRCKYEAQRSAPSHRMGSVCGSDSMSGSIRRYTEEVHSWYCKLADKANPAASGAFTSEGIIASAQESLRRALQAVSGERTGERIFPPSILAMVPTFLPECGAVGMMLLAGLTAAHGSVSAIKGQPTLQKSNRPSQLSARKQCLVTLQIIDVSESIASVWKLLGEGCGQFPRRLQLLSSIGNAAALLCKLAPSVGCMCVEARASNPDEASSSCTPSECVCHERLHAGRCCRRIREAACRASEAIREALQVIAVLAVGTTEVRNIEMSHQLAQRSMHTMHDLGAKDEDIDFPGQSDGLSEGVCRSKSPAELLCDAYYAKLAAFLKKQDTLLREHFGVSGL